MDAIKGLFSLESKTISKLLVVLFATLMCTVLVVTSADDSAAADDSKYTIKWYIIDNDETVQFKSDTLSHGDLIVAPYYTKDSTPEFKYTLKWKGYYEGMKATGSEDFYGEYTPVTREYIITWNVEGKITSEQVPYGIMPTNGTPTKESTTKFMYTFNKWVDEDGNELVAVIGPANYTATFTKTYIEVPSTIELKDLIEDDNNLVLQINSIATGTIDKSVFKYLNEKGNSLTINMMDGNDIAYSWAFKGAYKSEGVTTFHHGISESTPSGNLNDAINSAEIKNTLVLKFKTSGELPINASVKYNVADMYTDGTKLSLFFYNEETKQLEDQSQNITVSNGFVTFNLTHCSYYVLSQDDPVADNMLLYIGIAVIIVLVILLVAVAIHKRKA